MRDHYLEPEDKTLVIMKDYIEKQREASCHPVLLLLYFFFFFKFSPSCFASQRFNYFFYHGGLFLLYVYDSSLNFSEDSNITHFKVLFYIVASTFSFGVCSLGVLFNFPQNSVISRVYSYLQYY